MSIITRKHAQALIRARKAVADGYTVTESRQPKYITLTRYDLQRVDHYRVAAADKTLLARLGAQ